MALDGTRSDSETPVASPLPTLVTVSVYVIALPGATGPEAGLLVFVSVRFGLVLMVSVEALLERVPDVPPSATVAVFETAVVPDGTPEDATSMSKVTVAVDPAASDPMFFERTLATTGSGPIVEPFSFALPAT